MAAAGSCMHACPDLPAAEAWTAMAAAQPRCIAAGPELGVGRQDPGVHKIAKKLGKTPAQVLLRWGIQHGSAVIPRSGSEAHQRVRPGSGLYHACPACSDHDAC